MAYHHGNARKALLAAAASMLEGRGAAGLSLRSVAEAAGLSRQAPYNHFANKEAMLAELVGDGFADLLSRMNPMATAEPFARLVAAADGYIEFGTERPALFRLMFAREIVDVRNYPDVQIKVDAALECLRSVVAKVIPADFVAEATLVAWSLIHGYTELCNETGIEGPEWRARRAELCARTVVGLNSLRRSGAEG